MSVVEGRGAGPTAHVGHQTELVRQGEGVLVLGHSDLNNSKLILCIEFISYIHQRSAPSLGDSVVDENWLASAATPGDLAVVAGLGLTELSSDVADL